MTRRIPADPHQPPIVDPMTHPLHNRWNALCERIGAFKNAHESDMTLTCSSTYTHPVRAYHNLGHIAQVLGVFDQSFRLADDRELVEYALWLHDCGYIAERPDNEERSADAAAMIAGLLGAPSDFAARARECIMATRHSIDPGPGDPALVADIDLSILAASPADYDAYRRAIRREFGFAEDALFIQGRIAFVQRMLARPAIYTTQFFKRQSENAAHDNLQRELEELERGVLLA